MRTVESAMLLILAMLAACQPVTTGTYQKTIQPIQSQSDKQKQSEPVNRREENHLQTVRNLSVAELPQTIRQEHEDRTNRLARLSRQFGSPAPSVQDNLQVDAGTLPGVDHPAPVIRVRYPERTFFDTGKADVKPESKPILDVLAESMKRDMPDTNLLILGHTDSRGTNDYNYRLSLDRAKAVMIELANRGVPYEQMATIGIGELQPIATNQTDEGMALNRRVEFMISRFLDANLRLVEETTVNAAFLNNHRKATTNVENSATRQPVMPENIIVPHADNGEVGLKQDKGKVDIKPDNVAKVDSAFMVPEQQAEGKVDKIGKGATLPVFSGNEIFEKKSAKISTTMTREVKLRPPVIVEIKKEENGGPAQKL